MIQHLQNILTLLSKRNDASAEADLTTLKKKLAQKTKILASFQIPVNTPENNTPPGSGYSSQLVKVMLEIF